MFVAFDTSLLVAALREVHPHHPRAAPWVAAAKRGDLRALAPAPVLSETFSALTAVPGLRIKPSAARSLVVVVLDYVEFLPVSCIAQDRAMEKCARVGSVSGAIFDAVIMAAAEEAGVDAVITFNFSDFDRFRSDDGPVIVTPPDPPSVVL